MKIFYDIIFKPLVDLLAPHNKQVKIASKELKNSSVRLNAKFDPIVAGINSGRIQYVDSIFSGDFNASISKALKSYGATFNKRTKTFALAPEFLPAEILEAAENYAAEARNLHDALRDKLSSIERSLSWEVSKKKVDAGKVVSTLDDKFDDEYSKALDTKELSERGRKNLAEDYANNMSLWVKKFSADTIKELRTAVEDNATTGYRFDELIDRIQDRYAVSRSKAKFLARNETSLYVSKHRQARFADVGITKYIWRTAGDGRVREDHKHLNGKEFEYKNPPIVDIATGRRANPGEDYLCRCVAEPVLPSVLTEDLAIAA